MYRVRATSCGALDLRLEIKPLLQTSQIDQQVLDRLIPIFDILLESFGNDLVEPFRCFRCKPGNRRWFAFNYCCNYVGRSLSIKWRRSSDHLVQDHTETP